MRDSLRGRRLPGRCVQSSTNTQQKNECEQQYRRDEVQPDKRSHSCGSHRRSDLDNEEKSPLFDRISERTAYEPDAVVYCGTKLPSSAIEVPNPMVVVEVLSPSTRNIDLSAKLADYFRVPSIHHYLIARTGRPTIIHHRRGDGELIETRVIAAGALRLDPPGITLDLDRIYG